MQAKDARGGFVRQTSSFRRWIGEPELPPEAGRYRLLVSLTCPWASRTLVARGLKGLESVIDVSVVEPKLTAQGWRFADGRALADVYVSADPHYTGRATVPVLWDEKDGTIVNNESSGHRPHAERVVRRARGQRGGSLSGGPPARDRRARGGPLPPAQQRGLPCQLATTQEAYEDGVRDVSAMLDALEERVASRRYLVGEVLTEVDIRLFVTLVRFNLAYHGLFKCNLRRLADYPNLTGYVRALLAMPAFRDATNPEHIKRGYYSVAALNPSGIVPLGPLDPFGLDPSGSPSVRL